MPSRLLSGKKLVGVKQSKKAVAAGRVQAAYIAQDADPAVTRPFERLCEDVGCEVVAVPSMAELGRMCGIEVASAVAVLLK